MYDGRLLSPIEPTPNVRIKLRQIKAVKQVPRSVSGDWNQRGKMKRMKPDPTYSRSARIAIAALATIAIAGGAVLGASSHAQAQTAAPQAQSQVRETGCTPSAGKLGVSRVVEIDTAHGPHFGLQQYPDHDFLRENEVVLTFDDGPLRRHTRMVLEALAAHCTRATFYMVGQMAVVDPEMVREIAGVGHTIAIHTWSHKNMRSIGAPKAQHEIELGISAVQRALGQPIAPFFRFPYLADSPAMLNHLRQRNFAVFSIDADSSDFRTKNPAEMQRNIFKALAGKRKGILLFHDIQFSTAHGIRAVLDQLAREGYRVVHTVPKTPAVTDPRFDALADAELQRRNKIAATNPMATRSVVWPMSAPSGVPTEQYNPELAAAGTRLAPKPAVQPAAAAVAVPGAVIPRQRATPAAGTAPAPTPAAAPVTPTPPPPSAVPATTEPRPALRGTTEDEDWRRKVFQN